MPVDRRSSRHVSSAEHPLLKTLDKTTDLAAFVKSEDGRLRTQNDDVVTAAAGAAAPSTAQIVLCHGDTGSALVPLKVSATGHLSVDFDDEGGIATEATQALVQADTATIAADTTSLDAKVPAQGQAAMAGSVPVAIAADQTPVPVTSSGGALATEATLLLVEADTTTIAGAVSGSEMQVDLVDLGGAATAAKQPALGTAGSASADVISVQGIASMTALVVDGSAVTQPISAASLPLPTGAAQESTLSTLETHLSSLDGKVTACDTGAVVVSSSALPSGASTAAKQPALGTAGSASADVISVQGIASMTALVVDGSAVTQPISATSLPLPTGAAQESTLSSIDGKVTECNTAAVQVTSTPHDGAQANLWSAATPGAAGKSTALDAKSASVVDIFGDVDGACTLTAELSADNTNWYTSTHSVSPSGAGDFHLPFRTGARYVRLSMSAAGVAITATGVAKS